MAWLGVCGCGSLFLVYINVSAYCDLLTVWYLWCKQSNFFFLESNEVSNLLYLQTRLSRSAQDKTTSIPWRQGSEGFLNTRLPRSVEKTRQPRCLDDEANLNSLRTWLPRFGGRLIIGYSTISSETENSVRRFKRFLFKDSEAIECF